MSERFSRERWLVAGLEQLARKGPGGLKLANMCESQQRTTGSFYYHFKNHSEFVNDVIGHWELIHTDRIIATVQTVSAPDLQSENLTSLVTALDQTLEVAIRFLASQNEDVKRMLAGVDQKRIEFLCQLRQQDMGLGREEAFRVAELEYAAFVGAQMIWQNNISEHSSRLEMTFQKLISK